MRATSHFPILLTIRSPDSWSRQEFRNSGEEAELPWIGSNSIRNWKNMHQRSAGDWCLPAVSIRKTWRERSSIVKPFAVDVSTGVEDAPGIKSLKKIKEFMNALRNSGNE